MKNKLTSLILLASLSIPSIGNATSIFLDPNYSPERKKTQCCLDVDDLYKYQIPAPLLLPINGIQATYKNEKDMVDYLTKVYGGCEFREQELKQNPNNQNEDGIVFMIWGDEGDINGRKKTLYDTLTPDRFTITKMAIDETIYHTLDDTLKSPEYQRLKNKSGKNKIFIQSMKITGQNQGLYNHKGKLVVNQHNQKVE